MIEIRFDTSFKSLQVSNNISSAKSIIIRILSRNDSKSKPKSLNIQIKILEFQAKSKPKSMEIQSKLLEIQAKSKQTIGNPNRNQPNILGIHVKSEPSQ